MSEYEVRKSATSRRREGTAKHRWENERLWNHYADSASRLRETAAKHQLQNERLANHFHDFKSLNTQSVEGMRSWKEEDKMPFKHQRKDATHTHRDRTFSFEKTTRGKNKLRVKVVEDDL
eukprot:TRINITY_DN60_c3_g1_i1.p1 TRINITY_DN60_c3_g1~~TRINITY_DN60_c3_g1_i1.p1  ORF type:complete len:137 (+),score=37.22 TRINITY_DN60_c3_g1_i1:53-412(+)